MKITFFKYHGTGNDFILIDDRKNQLSLTTEGIRFLCNRNFGIGADGLMFLNNKRGFDFSMSYYNSDGLQAKMCGNGGRCIVLFAKHLGIENTNYHFYASDGEHNASINGDEIILKMNDVYNIKKTQDYYLMDTGNPHFVRFAKNLEKKDVFAEGRKIRYSPEFINDPKNVNFVEPEYNSIFVRTYEKGVENETLSCGTGAIASVIATYIEFQNRFSEMKVRTNGGILKVGFEAVKSPKWCFKNVYLSGEAKFVFKGELEL